MKKLCKYCDRRKDLDEFHIKRAAKDGHRDRCKACVSRYHDKWYKINRKERIAQCAAATARWRKKKASWVDGLKNVPCIDCGRRFPPYVMDFDHVRGDKQFDISKAVATHGASEKRIEEEIKKCEIVCANCHRIRTHNRSCSLVRKAPA